MCPRYILSDNGTVFKNQLMDQVLQQLSIDCIFSAPYHPQSNRKLDVFHKYLMPTLKKLCKKDPTNWDKYLNQVLASYRVTPNLATAEKTFSLNECRLLILFNFQFRNSNFLWNRTIFPGTQAFTSPPDMASSGVWENIILCKTPTFDGVCGKFFYIILIW